MRSARLGLELVLLAVLLLLTLLPRLASSASSPGQTVDTAMIERLTSAEPEAPPASVQAAAADSGRLAAILAAGLLADPIGMQVNLPYTTR